MTNIACTNCTSSSIVCDEIDFDSLSDNTVLANTLTTVLLAGTSLDITANGEDNYDFAATDTDQYDQLGITGSPTFAGLNVTGTGTISSLSGSLSLTVFTGVSAGPSVAVNGAASGSVNSASSYGFYGTTAQAKPTVTGSFSTWGWQLYQACKSFGLVN